MDDDQPPSASSVVAARQQSTSTSARRQHTSSSSAAAATASGSSSSPGTRRHVVSQHRRKASVTITKHSDVLRQHNSPKNSPTRPDRVSRAPPPAPPAPQFHPVVEALQQPARPQAPTPTKASEQHRRVSPPGVPALQLTPRGNAAVRGSQPGGPRPLMSPRSSAAEVVTMTTVPAIMLQEPSPNRPPSGGQPQPSQQQSSGSRHPRDRSSNGSSHSHHQSAQGPLSIGVSAPASPSPLAIPQVENLDIQKFLDDIALQLSHIQAGGRSSVILQQPTSPTESLASPVFPSTSPGQGHTQPGRRLPSPTSPQQMTFPPFRPTNAASAPPPTPVTPMFHPEHTGMSPDQFEDAEDDVSDVNSIHSSIRHPYDPRQPWTPGSTMSTPGGGWLDHPQELAGLGITSNLGPRSRETLRPPNSPASRTNRWSTASGSSTTSSQVQAQTHQQHQPQYRSTSGSSYASDGTNKENGQSRRSSGSTSQQQQQQQQQHDSRSSRGSGSSAYSAPPNPSAYYPRPSFDRTPTKNSSLSVPPAGGRPEAIAYGQQTPGANGRVPLGEAKLANGNGSSAGERRSAPGALPPPPMESGNKVTKKGRKREFNLLAIYFGRLSGESLFVY